MKRNLFKRKLRRALAASLGAMAFSSSAFVVNAVEVVDVYKFFADQAGSTIPPGNKKSQLWINKRIGAAVDEANKTPRLTQMQNANIIYLIDHNQQDVENNEQRVIVRIAGEMNMPSIKARLWNPFGWQCWLRPDRPGQPKPVLQGVIKDNDANNNAINQYLKNEWDEVLDQVRVQIQGENQAQIQGENQAEIQNGGEQQDNIVLLEEGNEEGNNGEEEGEAIVNNNNAKKAKPALVNKNKGGKKVKIAKTKKSSNLDVAVTKPSDKNNVITSLAAGIAATAATAAPISLMPSMMDNFSPSHQMPGDIVNPTFNMPNPGTATTANATTDNSALFDNVDVPVVSTNKDQSRK